MSHMQVRCVASTYSHFSGPTATAWSAATTANAVPTTNGSLEKQSRGSSEAKATTRRRPATTASAGSTCWSSQQPGVAKYFQFCRSWYSSNATFPISSAATASCHTAASNYCFPPDHDITSTAFIKHTYITGSWTLWPGSRSFSPASWRSETTVHATTISIPSLYCSTSSASA